MPMGKLSKVLSILKTFSITDFYLSKSCIIQLHLKSALACMPMNSNNDSKQYVFQLHALALCDTANISTSGCTHTCTWCEHLVLPVLFFWSGKQVPDWEHLQWICSSGMSSRSRWLFFCFILNSEKAPGQVQRDAQVKRCEWDGEKNENGCRYGLLVSSNLFKPGQYCELVCFLA